MPKNSVCLDTTSLNSLSQGSCQEPLLTWHLWHLEECTECCERLEQLIPTDIHRFETHVTLTLGSNTSTKDHHNQPWAGLENILQNYVPPVAMPKLDPSESQNEIGRLGEFRILKPIGAGHSAIVFEAEDIWLQRRVAIKILRRDMTNIRNARQLFLAEAQAVASIVDKNVVPILNIGQQNDEFFLVMPLLDGESLKTVLETRSFTTAEALKIIREIASGLAAAHKIGLIHCDIKPNNVWLMKQADGTEVAVLLDFGLSALNSLNIIAGTPGFMAPEQISGGKLDTKTDLFGLGCLLMETLRPARLRFHHVSEADTEAEHEFKTLLKPLLPLLQKLLNPDPTLRPASTTSVIEMIRRLEKPRNKWLIPALVAITATTLLGFTLQNTVQPAKPTKPARQVASIPQSPQQDLFSEVSIKTSIPIGKNSLFAFDSNSQKLIWAEPNGSLFLKNISENDSMPTRWQSSLKPYFLSLNPTCQYLAVASIQGKFEVWDLSPNLAAPRLLHSDDLDLSKLNDMIWSDEPKPRLAFGYNLNQHLVNPFLSKTDPLYQQINDIPYEPIKLFSRPKTDEILCITNDGGIFGWSNLLNKSTIGFRTHNSHDVWLASNSKGDRIVSVGGDGFFLEYDGIPQKITLNPNVALGWGIGNRMYLNSSALGVAMISQNTVVILVDKASSGSSGLVMMNLDNPNPRMFLHARTNSNVSSKFLKITNQAGSPEIACLSEDGVVNIFDMTDQIKVLSTKPEQK